MNYSISVEKKFRKVFQATIYTLVWSMNEKQYQRQFTSKKRLERFVGRGMPLAIPEYRPIYGRQGKLDTEFYASIKA